MSTESPKCNTCSTLLIEGSNWSLGNVKKNTYNCKPCLSSRQRKWHAANKERQNELQRRRYVKNREHILAKQKEKYLDKTFGITLEEYQEIFQGASCSICSDVKDLVLDHDHQTGKVREVLCRKCNCALGLYKDSVELLENAIEYLNKHKGPS